MAHASQVSDAVLDACLEQDHYAKAITHNFLKCLEAFKGCCRACWGGR